MPHVRDVVRRRLEVSRHYNSILNGCHTYRRREVQALCGHSLAWGLKCYDWYTKRNSKKRRERAAKRMPSEPYFSVGKHKGDVVKKVLKPPKMNINTGQSRKMIKHTVPTG